MIALVKTFLNSAVSFGEHIIKSIFKNHKPRAINEKKYRDNLIYTNHNDIEYILASSNVIKLSVDGKTYYFREFEKHLPIKRYVLGFIDEYFDLVKPDKQYKQDKGKILLDLKNKEKFKMFISMGAMYPATTPFHRFYRDGESPEILGLNGYCDDEYIKRLKTFCRFSANKLSSYYRENEYLFNNKRHYYSADRNFAFKKMLKLFDMTNLAPEIDCCFLNIDQKYELFGSIMAEANGFSVVKKSSEERTKRITPQIQRVLTSLSLIDYLCKLIDHTPRNYNVITDEKGLFVNVQCFDNDDHCSFGYEKTLVFKSYPNVESFVSANGIINRPHLDKSIAALVMDIKKQVLFNELREYLKQKQIYRIWQRLLFLKSAIIETQRINSGFLITESQWNSDTIKEELSGKYGNTYLSNLIEVRTGPQVEIT